MTIIVSPRAAAHAAWSAFPVRPTTVVTYRSSGRLLVVGPQERLNQAVRSLPSQLTLSSLATEDVVSDVRVFGHLGSFSVSAELDGRTVDINRLLLAQNARFDLVLDLQDSPAIPLAVPPIGYRAASPESVEQALAELAELVGEFDKPKFFEHRPDICAHGASGIEACRACLDVCGAGAIRSERLKIVIDPYLCQGCGDCATVCPAGAMNYLYPRRGDSLERLRRMLDAWLEAGGVGPTLVLHDEANDPGEALPDDMLAFPLEALGAAGLDFWLSALAYGCRAVRLLAPPSHSAQSAQALASQIGIAEELLRGLGVPAGLIQLVTVDEVTQMTPPSAWTVPRARHAGDDDKRTVVRLALTHLHRHAPLRPEVLPLSVGAPFGDIRVDTERCTLCMACVSICPEQALADGGDVPRLSFIEAHCVQCGLCREACPEHAIDLTPQYRFDAVEARRPRRLHEEAAFQCIVCGKPFATAAMIRAITTRLQGHPMFQGERLRHLQMCEDCRIKALYSTEAGLKA